MTSQATNGYVKIVPRRWNEPGMQVRCVPEEELAIGPDGRRLPFAIITKESAGSLRPSDPPLTFSQ